MLAILAAFRKEQSVFTTVKTNKAAVSQKAPSIKRSRDTR